MPKIGKDFFVDLIRFIIITLVIVVPIRTYVAQPFIVSGVSMSPSFENGEYLIVDELSYHLRAPERGEVIVFRYPKDPSKFFIKRVIGLPQETVVIEGNQITIESAGGKIQVNEPYIRSQHLSDKTVSLGLNEYFVLGDNRDMSLDSRIWGPVTENLIQGRVLLRLFPFNEIEFLPAASGKPTHV